METEEDDTSKTSPASPIPEPEVSTAPSGPQQEPGPASVQCEPATAARLEDPPSIELEPSLAGEGGGGSAGAEGEGSEAAACLVAEPSVAAIEKDEDGAGGRGDDAVVEERGLVVAAATSPQAQSPPLVAETDRGHLVGGEGSEAAADCSVSESAGAGVEEMSCGGVGEAEKNDMEQTAVTAITDAVEESQLVVEEAGKETVSVADKGGKGENGVDHMKEVENQSEAVAAEQTESEAIQVKGPLHTEGEADEMEITHGEVDRDGVEAGEDVSTVAEDAGTDQKEEAEEPGGEMDVVHVEADKGEVLAVKEAAGVTGDNTKSTGAVEDSTTVDMVEVETKDDMVAEAEEAAGDKRRVDDDMVEAETEKAEDSTGVGGDEAQEAAVENKEVTENVLEEAEVAVGEDLGVVGEEAQETAVDKREVDEDVLEEAEAGAAEDMGVFADEAEEASMDNREVNEDELEEAEAAMAEDTGVGADEAEEASMDNREVDEDVLEEEEAAEGEDMEVLHDDTDATEETDAMEEAEKAEEVSGHGVGMKRKRGKAPKASTARTPSRKKMEEDVCFVCFDGGDLVLCDRRGCPKAYHPSCVNRDEAFFRTKGQWNCGWHLCSNCGKNAYYMCYTCTYSLCKTCIKDGSISCIRRNKGFCRTCMKTITMIEDSLKGDDEMNQVDFDDKSSWEYLFKDYYMDLKARLSLTPEELTRATNLWKGSDGLVGKQDSPHEARDDSENSAGDTGVTVPKRRQSKRRAKSLAKGRHSPISSDLVGSRKASIDNNFEWASKELVAFVMHMRDGDRSVLSQFDVQALLLEYIKRNKLRDPKRKSQIICDQRLQNLFGKPRVGHFEMLKLLESHYFVKEDADDLQGTVVDTDTNQSEVDGNYDVSEKPGRDKRRRTRKKGDERGLQSNQDDYAAIDTHNINLMYLRRNLLEDLLEDAETFHDKVVGAFVRIRISGSNQKQDIYRLVPVVGTSKAAEQYKVGKKMTDFVLEILNLNKTEVISVDIISNQEFTEDECKRLRQSIKCGLINRLTVGNIQEKAMALQTVRVKDWLETETVRLSHLRDRASDMGRRKELRECVEKLQLLKTPEERQRRLEEIPEIHVDPKMDPSYESEEDEPEADDKRQDNYIGGARGSSSFRSREPISPRKGGSASYDSWSSGTRTTSMTPSREFSRNLSSKSLSARVDDYGSESVNESSSWGQVKERETPYQLSTRDNMNMHVSSSAPEVAASRIISNAAAPETQSTGAPHPAPKVNEAEKMWHYKDPAGKIQGPFSMVQLRKWNNTGYFPVDLRIWRATEEQEESILLTDALNGKFKRDPPTRSSLEQNRETLMGKAALSSVDVPKYSGGEWGSSGAGTNLPSPTPGQTMTTQIRSMNTFSGGNGAAQAPTSASNASHGLSQGAQVLLGSSVTAPSQLHSQGTVPVEPYSNQVVDLHNLIQAVARNQNQSNPVQTETVAPSPAAVNMSGQTQVQGTWAATGGAVSSIPSYPSYGSSGPANPWRPPGSTDQSNVQSSAPALNMNWSYGNNSNNQSSNNAGNNYSATAQNPTWNQMPGSVGWSAPAPVPGNAPMNWAAPAQGAPGRNPTWAAQGQVQAPANPPQMGWDPTGNPNPGYAKQGQGPAPTGSNTSTWAPPGNQNGDGSQRNRPWSGRQPSFSGSGGGNGGGGPSRLTGWCRFFRETGHCKKGASCNYRHT